jgi:hypothetical protein
VCAKDRSSPVPARSCSPPVAEQAPADSGTPAAQADAATVEGSANAR